MPRIRKEWYIIVNPHAGSGKTMRYWVPAEARLQELGIPYNTVYTTHKRHAAELSALAARTGYRKIMAVGGDGSIHEVFEGVLGWCETSGTDPSEFYLAVAPIGSGNDWIKSFGVPKDVMKVLEIVARDTFVQEDVVRVTLAGGKVSWMANIGGLGFDSHVCERVNAQKDRGMRSSSIYLPRSTVEWAIREISAPSSSRKFVLMRVARKSSTSSGICTPSRSARERSICRRVL